MGIVKTASESILEETVVPSEEANYSLQGHADARTIKVAGRLFARSLSLKGTQEFLLARDATGLKAMWRATHSRATANRCLEIQIYSPRCFHAPVPSGKFDLRHRCNIRLYLRLPALNSRFTVSR
ncbi:hypothetical protein EAG_03611 [Camponotus floridanus]|uniref:Uncharacterized protein n=1 Tax=Camponotus floridanus TaxID=104421 RepID=E2AP09_CAMFO|nr:hypothetical protein EAG_03611 [Camponotus floridanus]